MFTREFLLDALERLVATFVQALLAIVTADGFTDAFNTDWKGAVLGALLAAALSAIKSVVSTAVGSRQTPQALPGGGTYDYEPGGQP